MLTVGFHSLFVQPSAQFIVGDDSCPSAMSNSDGITEVITMTVTQQNKIRVYLFRRDLRGGIAGEEWIDQQVESTSVKT
jgi:hypothetical protein